MPHRHLLDSLRPFQVVARPLRHLCLRVYDYLKITSCCSLLVLFTLFISQLQTG